MLLGKVVEKVVCTVKVNGLKGLSLVVVEPLTAGETGEKELLVAADTIGCGKDNIVIVASGSAARLIDGCEHMPIDLAIIGIVDNQIKTHKES